MEHTSGYLKNIRAVLLTPIEEGLNQYSLFWYRYSVWNSAHAALAKASAV